MYVNSDTLLLANVLENFRNMYFEIYKLNPEKFTSAPELAWQAPLKRAKLKLDLLIDIYLLLMVGKCIRGVICHLIYRYAKTNNKYMKGYDKNKEPPYLQYWDVNNLYGWTMLQKLLVNNFEWIEDTSQFNEDFVKTFNEQSDKEYFLEADVQYLEKLHDVHNNLPFLPEGMKMENVKKLVTN